MSTTSSDFDIIALTETWLHPGVMDNELFDSSFQVFRRDRYTDASKLGGGLLLGFRNTLTCSRVDFPVSLNDLDIEIISVRVSLKSKDIYVVNCYIPPSSQNRQFSNGKNIFENVILHLDFLEDIIGSQAMRSSF